LSEILSAAVRHPEQRRQSAD